MSRKNILLLIAVLLIGFTLLFGCVFFLLLQTDNSPVIEPEPIVTNPYINEDEVTIPTEKLEDLLEEVGKTGFDSQTQYWVDKLNTVTNVEEALNQGLTIEYLCQQYFYKEYKEYKNTMLLGADDLEEYPEDKSDELYKEFISCVEQQNFTHIIATVDNLLNTYKFTMPHNYKICNIYQDAIKLDKFSSMTSAAKVQSISTLKIPECMLVAAVGLGYKEQCSMYTFRDSICMNEGTKIKIQNVEVLTAKPDSQDLDDRLMQVYFGDGNSDLTFTKITFVVDFEASGFTPSDFGHYFNYYGMSDATIESQPVRIFDEEGNVIHNLGDYTEDELSEMKLNTPEYTSYIEQELLRRNTLESTKNEPEVEEDFNGMASATDENLQTYNDVAFERYKNTVYEIYIPQYETHYEYLNRIYMIKQISNLDLPCCGTIHYFKNLYKENATFQKFVYSNQWSYNSDDDDLAEEIAKDHSA